MKIQILHFVRTSLFTNHELSLHLFYMENNVSYLSASFINTDSHTNKKNYPKNCQRQSIWILCNRANFSAISFGILDINPSPGCGANTAAPKNELCTFVMLSYVKNNYFPKPFLLIIILQTFFCELQEEHQRQEQGLHRLRRTL